MNLTCYIKLFLFSLFLVTLNLSLAHAQQDIVRVRGRIETNMRIPLEGVRVIFTRVDIENRPGSMTEVRSNEDGEYLSILRKGLYEIRIDEWAGKIVHVGDSRGSCSPICEGYFHSVSRAKVDISPFSSLTLSFVIPIEGYSTDAKPIPAFYETVQLEGGTNVVIRYAARSSSDSLTRFLGTPSSVLSVLPTVMITYNQFTITSDTAVLDERTRVLVAEGRVTVADGLAGNRVSKVIINLASSRPNLSIER